MNIYVGNLSFEVKEDDLRQAFEAYGKVESATIIMDKFSGESRGFGFVEMASKDEATAAIAEMNGKDLKGRALNVNEARPKTEGGGGGAPLRQEMQRLRPLLGPPGAYAYGAAVPALRAASDYTVRVIPQGAGMAVPLEAAQILWQPR